MVSKHLLKILYELRFDITQSRTNCYHLLSVLLKPTSLPRNPNRSHWCHVPTYGPSRAPTSLAFHITLSRRKKLNEEAHYSFSLLHKLATALDLQALRGQIKKIVCYISMCLIGLLSTPLKTPTIPFAPTSALVI